MIYRIDIQYLHTCTYMYVCVDEIKLPAKVSRLHSGGIKAAFTHSYGVATISRLLQIIGLMCKRALLKRPYSAKETYDFKEPCDRSHPILLFSLLCEMCHMTYDIQH